MEFVVPILTAVASSAATSAVEKLSRVIANLVAGAAKTDATFIKNELQQIKDLIEANSSVGRYVGPSQSTWIAILRSLAYDIEDCIDCFEAKKTSPEEFAAEITQLKTRSEDTRRQILEYMKMHGRLQQGQQPVAPPAAAVPHQVQQLLGGQSKDWLNCMLYFCMFPHDHHARRNPLIRRWLAERLVNEGGEAKAKQYLEDLINGSIISATAKCNNGNMKRCQPPNEIRDFIRQQSSSTNFMLFCEDMARLEAGSARRLSLHPNQVILGAVDLPAFPNLHTLAVFHDRDDPHIYETIVRFDNYGLLRVLDLKECVPLSKEHLLAICNLLLLLKYLSFRYGGTDQLPREIGKLACLETLDMRGSETVTVYEEVLMMPRLKHLLGKFQLSKRDTYSWISRDRSTSKLGVFLGKKSQLETLSGFVTGERRGFPQLMILMRKLRKVKIWCKANASKANLRDISSAITKFVGDGIQLESAGGRSLSINFQECSRQFLHNLQVQQGALASLKLHGNLNEFPQFVTQLSVVEELCLSSTALSWNVILAGLSNLNILKYLKLVEDNLGPIEIQTNNLRSLERLCLVCVPNLDITIKAGALPGLVSLHLICQHLQVIPGIPQMEITHMTDLQEVGLHSQLSNPAIKQDWEDAAAAHSNMPRVCDV